ncbi:Integrase/recombinase xerD homolog [Georgfuchsia toluolica]|uniref:Integrase/recombinase xerD homolog n=1 Tax=Georgfuchsia toluolica TaxID=424218 RepID=A0A916J4C1_9PROT|nr:site-specific integrase [Georgfuchsia toluolica]CAG4883726.1 Integrase/recombinase xerD homolog [Georgfuchsia toluolica]
MDGHLVADFTSDNPQLTLLKLGHVEVVGTAVNNGQGMQSLAGRPRMVSAYITAALADNSRRAYQGDLQDFLLWGGQVPCSPEMLAQYIAERAGVHSPHTITRRVVGISRAHTSKGLADPAKNDLVRVVLRGVRKAHGKPQRQVVPLLREDLFAILPLMHGTKGIRDRALILLGFAAALRRSELVALDVQDLEFVKEGLVVHLRKSKCDQESEGRKIAIPWGRTSACPVKAVQLWLDHAQISSGAAFPSVNKSGVTGDRLTAQSVALIVKTYAHAAGLPARNFSGHSLRAGLATSAVQAGASILKIKEQTGHKSDAMLYRYVRAGNQFVDNAAGLVL